MDYKKLAEILFPNIDKNIDYYEEKFPQRKLEKGACVTRLAPSPTGFIHLGNLYGALVDERLAHQSKGTMILRIEDTDHKRKVEGAEEVIINALNYFNINFDEGVTLDGEVGNYGPYHQSERKEIYQSVAKYLVENNKAYPSFVSEEELEVIREKQIKENLTTGYYGEFAKDRDLTFEEIEENLSQDKPWTLRLKSTGNPEESLEIKDAIRGSVTIHPNNMDIVILKQNGIPTYHFAHVVDDHFMRITHVVRGEEWLATLPVHIELFETVGWKAPIYCHTAHMMKMDDGNKRKLSKRKDPELSLEFYQKLGYSKEALLEYLMTILNSNFEEWRMKNKELSMYDFKFKLDKMSGSGALFDINKLEDISKEVLVSMEIDDVVEFFYNWAKEYEVEKYNIIKDKKEEVKVLFSIGRDGKKPRKDLVYASQMFDFISYFFDECFTEYESLPENVSNEMAIKLLEEYKATFSMEDNNSQWFDKVREISEKYNFAVKMKEYKQTPENFEGSIADVSTVIRLAITGLVNSPDIYSIGMIMGEDRVNERIDKYISYLK